MPTFSHKTPDEALAQLVAKSSPVPTDTEHVATIASFAGRVLADPLCLDRDSPACDVSAMDGYALHYGPAVQFPLPLAGECRIGEPPAACPPRSALRIYTGSPLPVGADTVLRLEQAHVEGKQLHLAEGVVLEPGKDVRYRGENGKQGDEVLSRGSMLTPAAIAAAATLGPESLRLFRPLRVALLTTGDEVVSEGGTQQGQLPDWKLRNSNGPALLAMLTSLAYVASVRHEHSADSQERLVEQAEEMLSQADVLVLTGAVSQGAYDFVPEVLGECGAEILFHGIAARPGRPTLGAIRGETPILALPGNPLAVLCAGRRLLVPLLRRRAGLAQPLMPPASLALTSPSSKRLPLAWWRPVRRVESGRAELVSLRGSGDTCGPASSDGFVEIPPNHEGTGPFDYYPWQPTS